VARAERGRSSRWWCLHFGAASGCSGQNGYMSVFLFENNPKYCPFGHRLGPGRVLVGWTPCMCAPAREAGVLGHGLGHLWVRCEACREEGWEATFYEPPHDVTQRHAR